MKTLRLITLFALMLFTTIVNAQTEEIYYYPKLPQIGKKNMNNPKTELTNILKSVNSYYYSTKEVIYTYAQNVLVFDDRIEMTFKKKRSKTIYFSDMLNYAIEVTERKSMSSADHTVNYSYFIWLGDIRFSGSSSTLEKCADYLFYFQHQLNVQRYDSLITIFKPIAAQYCALKVKPSISEEQRKLIVQANLLNESKQYNKAIELYLKSIELDQTSYPAAYSNLAFLSAQVNNFGAAIYYMKKYILLEPEAVDARSGQDKIYEWEILMQK